MSEVHVPVGSMFALYQLLLLYVLTGLRPNDAFPALGGKIINGNIAPANTMQFMASVQANGKHICGGFLIKEDFVVTAAHCDQGEPTHVVLGTHDLKKVDDRKRIRILKKYKYPDYQNAAKGDDIMLLKLAKTAEFDNSIQTIQFSAESVTENEGCFVAGWGAIGRGGTVDKLRVVDVSVINMRVCKEKWQNRLPENVICAGGYNTTKGFCQGDSGGPLVCKNKAFGIVSFNYHSICSYPSVPNVYVDISKYHDWIKNSVL